jgi:hypothetical protein
MNVKYAVFQSLGTYSFIMGSIFGLIALMVGQVLASLPFLGIAVGGLYLLHRSSKYIMNLVARPESFNDVYYDEKGLYYDKRGKPYLFKWDEVKEYRILSVTEVDYNPRRLYIIPVTPFLLKLNRYMVWRKIDPSYASTGIMKLGTVQFIKNDGSSIVVDNVLNPYRLVPIFDKYINENNQKKEYHM